jgi:hypothetical protein
MHNIYSFEGERYFFDVIAQPKGGKQTFEIRATCVDSGASATVTNLPYVMEQILDGAKVEERFKQPTWIVTAAEAKEFSTHSVALFSQQDKLELMEDAMNDDRAGGKWVNEEDFMEEEFDLDDDDDEEEWEDLEPEDNEQLDHY